MISSRKLDDLHPVVLARVKSWIDECEKQGIHILVTCTYRDVESQSAIYAQGRTKPGLIVTNAKPGQSWHNWRCAVDVVPLVNGKPVWGTTGRDWELWLKIGLLAEKHGLEWAGRWTGSLKEVAHFQYSGKLTIADLQSGKVIA